VWVRDRGHYEAVERRAVSEVEGRNPGPGVTWSVRGIGDDNDECRFEETVSPGTEARGDDNGVPWAMPRSVLYCGSTR
jgi:hypothetical protein